MQVELTDVSRDIERYSHGLVPDPDRLNTTEERLQLVARLARKHGVSSDDLLQRQDALEKEKFLLENADEQQAQIEIECKEVQDHLQNAGMTLSKKRRLVAHQLSDEVTKALRPLAMPGAEFRVSLQSDPVQAHATGYDTCRFEVMLNAGEGFGEITKVASGGELSRIALAIQSVLGDNSNVPTYVFDEIDAGIGGAVAEVVGQTLEQLGHGRQVLCVTHLAQIAALAQIHFGVEKNECEGRTTTHVERLQKSARESELARMLGGVKITEAVRRHAAELLGGRSRVIAARTARQ